MCHAFDERELQRQRVARAQAENRRNRARLWANAGVPYRHREPDDARRDHRAWAGKLDTLCSRLGSGALLAVLGPRGTGKTQLAVEAVRTVCGMGKSSRYVKAMDVFLALRASYSDGRITERSILAGFIGPSLLVIDEVGVRASTDFEDRFLTHLIDRRYDDAVDTILISNQLPDAFLASVGASIRDRIVETGGILECNWPSFRGRAGPMREESNDGTG